MDWVRSAGGWESPRLRTYDGVEVDAGTLSSDTVVKTVERFDEIPGGSSSETKAGALGEEARVSVRAARREADSERGVLECQSKATLNILVRTETFFQPCPEDRACSCGSRASVPLAPRGL